MLILHTHKQTNKQKIKKTYIAIPIPASSILVLSRQQAHHVS
jgi:hypothetical protein